MTALVHYVDIQQDNPAISFAPLGAMAQTIAEIIKTKGRCTPFDLIRDGYRPMEVFRNWGFAHAIGASAISKTMQETCDAE